MIPAPLMKRRTVSTSFVDPRLLKCGVTLRKWGLSHKKNLQGYSEIERNTTQCGHDLPPSLLSLHASRMRNRHRLGYYTLSLAESNDSMQSPSQIGLLLCCCRGDEKGFVFSVKGANNIRLHIWMQSEQAK